QYNNFWFQESFIPVLTVGYMAEFPTPLPPSRYKADMPDIPGIATNALRRRNPLLPLIIALAAVAICLLLALRWFSRAPKAVESVHVEPAPQIEVPAPPPDPNSLLPHADANNPVIAQVADLAKLWSSADFFIHNIVTGDNVPATIIRLPNSPATSPSGYWAFSRKAAYGDCQLEFITDLDKILKDYDYRHATHPLVGNPCSRTLYDPLKTANLPGNIWIRGAIVQGGDIRPPLGIEIKVQGKQILAVRTE
ncbi:MAG TPA: hypothetical protein VFL34_12900, partial [Candidatus Sulfotelmatobacter sp.]|nr:hypothetical protein [Candidatus Sulfotelmatobacter sp.]